MTPLLEKTRMINKILQESETVEYDGIARVLSNVLESNVYITNTKGKVFGYAFVDDFECDLMVDKVINQGEFPKHYVDWLNKMGQTSANLRSKSGMCAYEENTKCLFNGKNTTIVPIYASSERKGTLIVAKYDEEFDDDALLLAEYGATVVGMEMLRDSSKQLEIEANKKAMVKVAINTLSYSEVSAAISILTSLPGTEGVVVASKIADKVKITRSVIVNALRKFESAGVIESKSLGMKGTWIRVKNEYLLEEVQKLRN